MKVDILKRITDLRCQRGWTEYELALHSGLPQSTISAWDKRGMQPSIASLEKICQGLDITMSQLFQEDERTVTLQANPIEWLQKYISMTVNQKKQVQMFMDGIKGTFNG